MSNLSTAPSERDMAAAEVLDWYVDFANYLGTGETIASCGATLTNKQTGVAYPAGVGAGGATPAPSASGKIVTVWLLGLQTGQDYLLRVTIVTNQSRTEEAVTLFHCVA